MKRIVHAISFLAWFLLLNGSPTSAQSEVDDFSRQWVDYRDGEISLEFDQSPVLFALYAIEAKTGFQIMVPSSSNGRLLNLRLTRQPLEPAIRSLISTIGYQNFALLYDNSGRPSRAVVLNAPPPPIEVSNEAMKETASKQPLTTEQREKLEKDLSRWRELKEEERGKIKTRLKDLPESEERTKLITEYGRQMLEVER